MSLTTPRRSAFILLCVLLTLCVMACRDDEAPPYNEDPPNPQLDMSVEQDMSMNESDLAAGDLAASDLKEASEDDGMSPEEEMGSGLEPVINPADYVACALFVTHGPYGVGVTTIEVDGSPVEVFYPSDVTDAPLASYDLRDWLPEESREKIAQEAPTRFEMRASRDVPAASDGARWPLMIFSHGFAGYRLQSSALLAHMASWGFVVATPEHEGRGLAAVLRNELVLGNDDDTLNSVVDAIEARALEAPDGVFGRVELERVGVFGHSAGGGAAISLGRQERYSVVLGYAPAVQSFDGASSPDLGAKPKLMISGSADGLTRADATSEYMARQEAPWQHVVLEGAGHLAFSDICVIGREEGGILQIARRSGITVPITLRALGSDGCRARDLRVESAWPIIGHYSVAALRQVWGSGEAGEGLGDVARDCFGPLLTRDERAPTAGE